MYEVTTRLNMEHPFLLPIQKSLHQKDAEDREKGRVNKRVKERTLSFDNLRPLSQFREELPRIPQFIDMSAGEILLHHNSFEYYSVLNV